MPSLINNNQYKLPLISNSSAYKKLHQYIFTHPAKQIQTFSFWHNPKATWNNNSDTILYWTPHIDNEEDNYYVQSVSRENPYPQFYNLPQYYTQHEPWLEQMLLYFDRNT